MTDKPNQQQYATGMRLYDPKTRDRLYMDEGEREQFIKASSELKKREHRLFCQVMHWTGGRLSEVAELTGSRIDVRRNSIIIRTLKQRKYTRSGELKAPKFREIPIPTELIEQLDLFFDLRGKARRNPKLLDQHLWPSEKHPNQPMHRSTAWRIIKRVMTIAGIEGKQATAKGFRHGFGVAMAIAGKDVYQIQYQMGHEYAETTAIYLSVVGQEAHDLQMAAWEQANKNWDK